MNQAVRDEQVTVAGDYTRLIEYDLPIRALSALKGKRTLANDVDVRSAGIWWSRKPQHQCRAIWLAMLLPDPDTLAGDSIWRQKLHDLICEFGFLRTVSDNDSLRESLIGVCECFADPGSMKNESYRQFLRRLGELLHLGDIVGLDPFSGSGAIPIEATRIGLNVIAGEYNPMACLNLQFLFEDWAKVDDPGLDKLDRELKGIVKKTVDEVAKYHIPHSKLGQPYGYIRFRMLQCQGPGCGKFVPATSKFLLDSRNNTGISVVPSQHGFDLKLSSGKSSKDFPTPTVRAGALTCPSCGYTTPRKEVMMQYERLKIRSVIAAVAYKTGTSFTLETPTFEQIEADELAVQPGELDHLPVPKEKWPDTELRRFSPPLYGYSCFADCHTSRQQAFLGVLARNVSNLPAGVQKRLGALLLARTVDANTSFCRWRNDRGGSVENTFAGKSIGMIWDFFECNPSHPESGVLDDVDRLIGNMAASKEQLKKPATVLAGAAQNLALPDDSVDYLYTDPPYYDSVPYSHLSDWPFVWVNQTGVFSDNISNGGLVAKEHEIVVDRPHSRSPSTHDEDYFKDQIAAAFRECRRVLKPSGVAVIVFAHLNTSAWEALLDSLVSAGFMVTASWPVETERGGRLQAQGTASLQSSIHLVCRPRENPDGSLREEVGEWRDVLNELPQRIHQWMPRLAAEGIVGADAIFACIGPALEIFSRFSRVEKASGEDVPLIEYLEQIWAAVSTEALSMIFEDADAAGLEPDARLTAMWLWTLGAGRSNANGKSSGDKVVTSTGYTLEFDAARKIAQGLGVVLENSDSIVEVKGDKARLIPVCERTSYLFASDDGSVKTVTRAKKSETQRSLFEELDEIESEEHGELKPKSGQTVLDRVHQSLILFATGRGEALRRFLVDDGAGKDARFWKLAQSLSALYPNDTDEKRWVDGVLARKKGLGL